MKNPSNGREDGSFRDGLHSGAGALTGRRPATEGLATPAPIPEMEEWVNEGGSVRPPQRRASFVFPLRSQKAPADSVEGCRTRATADLVAAGTMATVNARRKLEHSAASWTARGDLLQRLDDSFEARRSLASAAWDQEEARVSCGEIAPIEPQPLRL